MLMKRLSSPDSSTSRSFSPGNWRSRSSTSPSTEAAFAWTSFWPLVSDRSGVGILTSTGIAFLLGRLGLEVGESLVEGRERGLDLHVGLEPPVERVRRLEPVAGDADDDGLVARDHARLDELLRRGDRHTARRLGEDALRPREQEHPFDDLLVGRVLAVAARLLRRLVRVVPVRGVADRERLGDRARPDGRSEERR